MSLHTKDIYSRPSAYFVQLLVIVALWGHPVSVCSEAPLSGEADLVLQAEEFGIKSGVQIVDLPKGPVVLGDDCSRCRRTRGQSVDLTAGGNRRSVLLLGPESSVSTEFEVERGMYTVIVWGYGPDYAHNSVTLRMVDRTTSDEIVWQLIWFHQWEFKEIRDVLFPTTGTYEVTIAADQTNVQVDRVELIRTGEAPEQTRKELTEEFSMPVRRDRHTTFLARFDSDDSNDAEYARTRPEANGKGAESDVEGKYGKGVEIAAVGSQVNFYGQGNCRGDRGTVQFWFRSKPGTDIWSDGREHWLFAARATGGDMGVLKDASNLLVVRWQASGKGWRSVSVPVEDVAPEDWHQIVFSWDSDAGSLWLGLDGHMRGVTGGGPLSIGDFYLLFLGASSDGHLVGETAGGTFDELKIVDLSLPELLRIDDGASSLSEEQAIRVQDAVRRNLDFIASLQRNGAWPEPLYSWPTMLHAGSSFRSGFHIRSTVNVTHGGLRGTPGAGEMFLYAYQVLGDARYLEVAKETGRWLLAAQLPEGHWVNAYSQALLEKPVPDGTAYAMLQDGHQSQAALFLAQLYMVTRQDKYLIGFRKSADFLMNAQNPNGSWSHHYNMAKARGETAGREPYGGEFNDECMQDQMNVMLAAYHLTGERKYLDALVRAGDWILDAQLGPPTCGWADQYDEENRPAWARSFEPPGLSRCACQYAMKLLFFMHHLTGDTRYIRSIDRCLGWVKTAMVRYRVQGEGKEIFHFNYDHETGRPIAARQRTIYFLDDPADRGKLLGDPYINPKGFSDDEFPWWRFEYASGPFHEEYQERLERAKAGEIGRAAPYTKEELKEQAIARYRDVEPWLSSQEEPGVWPDMTGRTGGIGWTFGLVDNRVFRMLQLIEISKILSEELDRRIWNMPSLIGMGRYGTAYKNWMDVGKLEGEMPSEKGR